MAILPKAAISWSGGKDCCTALHRISRSYDMIAMVTMFAEDGERSRSHGLRPAILAAHAERLGFTHFAGRCSWSSYTEEYIRVLGQVAALGVTHVIFGDIMFDEHRAWNERVCAANRLTAVLPLWNEPTDLLLREFLHAGGEASIVTARTPMLDESWLGRTLDLEMLAELDRRGVDPCGENGEYHTLVTNSPLFSSPLVIRRGRHVLRGECWALDVELAGSTNSGEGAEVLDAAP